MPLYKFENIMDINQILVIGMWIYKFKFIL